MSRAGAGGSDAGYAGVDGAVGGELSGGVAGEAGVKII